MEKIVHVCLCGPFSDGFSYQDNILSKYHKRLGNEVWIVTSAYSWGTNGKIVKSNRTNYINDDGIRIVRLKNLTHGKFAKFKGLYKQLCKICPSIIFVHGCNFLDLDTVRRYVKKNSVRLFVDNHADETNSATNLLSKFFLHRLIWKRKVQKICPYVDCFYGVLPKRCDFLKKMYSVPPEKVKLLLMGLDDDALLQRKTTIEGISGKIVSIGGKIDEYKAREICSFLEAFSNINHAGFCIVIYGSIIEKFKKEILKYCTSNSDIYYLGWLEHGDIVNVIKNSAYCVFPGRHSVLWEEAVCLGKPIVVKLLDGYDHVDIGGNVVYLKESNSNYYKNVLFKILDLSFLKQITILANNKARFKFLYSEIAKKSIE